MTPEHQTTGHQITIVPSTQRIVVSVDGIALADSDDALLLDETGLPTRYYLPREHVVVPLRPTELQTNCPFKGDASYWSAEVGDRTLENIAWSYEAPIPESEAIAGRVAFFAERVDVEIDGEPQDRPTTPWS
jgi:uncharacterized protein (DUF427 family)